MKLATKMAIDKFLFDHDMFKRTFARDVLIYSEDWIEFETIKQRIAVAEVESEILIWSAQMHVFLEKVFSRVSKFIPIEIDNFDDMKLFFELAILLRRHYSQVIIR